MKHGTGYELRQSLLLLAIRTSLLCSDWAAELGEWI